MKLLSWKSRGTARSRHGCIRRFGMALAVFIGAAAVQAAGHGGAVPRHVLDSLDSVLADAPSIAAAYVCRLDSIKATAVAAMRRGDLQGEWSAFMRLASMYRSFDTDSALLYGARARALAARMDDTSKQTAARISLVGSLSTAGLFADAHLLLDSVRHSGIPDSLRIPYWKSARLLYGYQGMYVDGHDYLTGKYRRLYRQCDDSLRTLLPPGDPFRRFIVSEDQVAAHRYEMARKGLEGLLGVLKPTDNLYGMVCYQMAEVCRHTRDSEGYALWLARGAESDIRANVREGLALTELSMWLYANGDLDQAFGYINFALSDATRGNARMRSVAIGKLMPAIDEAYRERISSSRDRLRVYFLMVFLLLGVSVALLWVLWRQIVRARQSRRRLADTTRRQDTYMGHFIALCSAYADRLDSLTRMVGRKLAAGEGAELQKMIKSGKFAATQEEGFGEMFDKAFLDIYPEFTSQVNSLLRPDEQLEPPPGTLTTELRIYALVRLGVTDSPRIAQVLHCSLNTVYSYRNRMRNRALDRDKFEEAVKELGATEE